MAENAPSHSRARSIFAGGESQSTSVEQTSAGAPTATPAHGKSLAIGTVVLLFFAAVAVAVVVEFKDVFGPVLELAGVTSTAASVGYTEVTTQQNGDLLSVQMKTDAGHPEKLCDQLMDQIYTLAGKNLSAHQLSLALQVEDKPETTVKVDDLDAVRQYRNEKAYAASGHRSFIGGILLAANLITAPSLTATPAADETDIIGNYYECGPEISPRFGLKFIDESQVEFFKDGVVHATCHYTVQGDTITIPTSCNTVTLRRDGDGFANELFMGVHMSRKEE